MDDSWEPIEKEYKIQKFLDQADLNRIIQNLLKCGVQQLQIEAMFKSDKDVDTFKEIYQQQISEDDFTYLQDQEPKKTRDRFRDYKDINTNSEFVVKALNFASYQLLNIFMKIYQRELAQLQIEYHYKLRVRKTDLRVYYPKNEKISSFFTNKIFDMKTKLHLVYFSDENVIKKAKYSKHFNDFMYKLGVATEYHIVRNVEEGIFYSNIHEKKQIIQIVNKNLLEHTSVISLFDRKLPNSVNSILFSLASMFLNQKISFLEKQYQIIIQKNIQKSCILVHDRHECFDDVRSQIKKAISHIINFKLGGSSMRTIYNKIIRSNKEYPYLRVNYKRRGLYCCIDLQILNSSPKHVKTFKQIFQEYFQTLNETSKVTFYLNYFKETNLIQKIQKLIEDKGVTIANYQHLMNFDIKCPKIIINGKDFNEFTIQKTKIQFFQVFWSVIFKQPIKNIVLNTKSNEPINLIKVPFQIFADNQSILKSAQGSSQLSRSTLTDTQNSQISHGNIDQILLQNKNYPEDKLKQKKSKQIQLEYHFHPSQCEPSINNFWNYQQRELKLERVLAKKYSDPFSKIHFKIYKLIFKNMLILPKIQEVEENKIWISTTIQKNNEIFAHFIDLNEFKKIQKQMKDKAIFIFFKIKQKQIYVPSYAIKLM